MFKVYKISWAGLKFEVESFRTLKEAEDFVNSHKDYCLTIERGI